MDPQSPPIDPFTAVADLRARGVPFVMATVVRAVSPTSAKAGDKALLTHRGVLAGWIGGSCAEPIVREEAEAALRDGECRLLHITPEANPPADRPGLSVHRMECYSGGELEIYLEPYLPMPSLLVFGNSPVARSLCDLGRLMRFRVTVVDLGDRPSMGDDIDVIRDLDKVPSFDPASTCAVVASHGVFDEESLEKALALGLRYVGFVTSARRRDQVFAALQTRGVPGHRLERIHAPAGLELGARQPQEIALAVMAQIVSVRRSGGLEADDEVRSPLPARERPEPAAEEAKPRQEATSCCHGPHASKSA